MIVLLEHEHCAQAAMTFEPLLHCTHAEDPYSALRVRLRTGTAAPWHRPQKVPAQEPQLE
jgi:hypothetical protein